MDTDGTNDHRNRPGRVPKWGTERGRKSQEGVAPDDHKLLKLPLASTDLGN